MFSSVCYYSIHSLHKFIRDAYNTLVEDLGQKIDATKEDVRSLIQNLSIKTGTEVRGVLPAGIPLNPRKENFGMLKFWDSGLWKKIWSGAAAKLSENAPVLSMFLEDEYGRPIPDDVKAQLLGDMQAYWKDLTCSKQISSLNYSQIGYRVREDFRTTMDGKYPFLRLCEGHWKVSQMWINYCKFKISSPPTSSRNNQAPNPPTLKEETPIDVSPDPDDTLIDLKHRRQDDSGSEALPLKKHKGKEREVVIFHPLWPKPKKSDAKMARVST